MARLVAAGVARVDAERWTLIPDPSGARDRYCYRNDALFPGTTFPGMTKAKEAHLAAFAAAAKQLAPSLRKKSRKQAAPQRAMDLVTYGEMLLARQEEDA